MPYSKNLKNLRRLFSAVIVFCSTAAAAHPHNWIDLTTQIDIDEQGQLSGFTQYWQFDQFFSMISYAELMTEYNDEALGLASTALKMVANVGPNHYFTTLTVDGNNVELPVPKLYTLENKLIDGNPILILKMQFSLSQELPVKDKTISLQTYEPTYFIAMNHLSSENIKINSSVVQCKTQLIEPNPSDEIISYASSLDRNIRDTEGLGDDFAERVIIEC